MNPFGFGDEQLEKKKTGRTIGDRNESLVQGNNPFMAGIDISAGMNRYLGQAQQALGNRIVEDSRLNAKYPGFGFNKGIPLEAYKNIERNLSYAGEADAMNSRMPLLATPDMDRFIPYLPTSPNTRQRLQYEYDRKFY